MVVTMALAFGESLTGMAATSDGHCELGPQLPISPTSEPNAFFQSSTVTPLDESEPRIFCRPDNHPTPGVCQPGSSPFRKSSMLAAYKNVSLLAMGSVSRVRVPNSAI